MKKILAVSGGPDSMLLLWRYRNDKNAVVAHFNHGTRPSADDDANFVEKMAKEYNKECFIQKEKLGSDVSEAFARRRRYEFLSKVQASLGQASEVKILTAHHLNDLVETIIINFLRGTAWRGLAPFSNIEIVRPFLDEQISKKDILKELAKHQISFRQDPTNTEENYLRNRIRLSVNNMDETTIKKIARLYSKQVLLRNEIELISQNLVSKIKTDSCYRRDFFQAADDAVAIEVLRTLVINHDLSLTGPQTEDFLRAIRTYQPEKKFNLPNDRFAIIKKNVFML